MHKLENKTKIVATLGPASSNKAVLKTMIESGVNVCRINFSHGSYEAHQEVINTIHEINDELNSNTGILTDLQGPKIRIGELKDNGFVINDGDILNFTTNKIIGTKELIYINYKDFPKDVKSGEKILIDDGKLMLEILETNNEDKVRAVVLHGGNLSSKKGVNLPNTKISLPCITPKDEEDLVFALENDVSWIALSFVRSANDIHELRAKIQAAGKTSQIIAKIEKPEAIENLEEIIEAADGCMVARGDLGVEIPMQDVPLWQKQIVRICQRKSKPVIIATQMMESMITSISPTRAEVNDVANAVLDGADAVMLSGETSVGKFPIEVIKAMYKIIIRIERKGDIYFKKIEADPDPNRIISDIICESATKMAKKGKVKAIITMSFSGYTGYKLSSYRPDSDIYVFTANKGILNTLSLAWGVRGIYYDKFVSTDHTMDDIRFILKQKGCVVEGDIIINIASMPIASKGMSNMMKMSVV
jgi:pyruvate kinase